MSGGAAACARRLGERGRQAEATRLIPAFRQSRGEYEPQDPESTHSVLAVLDTALQSLGSAGLKNGPGRAPAGLRSGSQAGELCLACMVRLPVKPWARPCAEELRVPGTVLRAVSRGGRPGVAWEQARTWAAAPSRQCFRPGSARPWGAPPERL